MGRGLASSTDSSPGKRSLAELRKYLLAYTQTPPEDAESNDLATIAVNTAIDRLNTENWIKTIKIQDVTLVANQSLYEAQLDVKQPRHAHLLNASSQKKGRLYYVDPKSFDMEAQEVTGSGNPSCYTFRHNERVWELDTPVSSGFLTQFPTLRFRYFRFFPHLVNPSDAFDAPGSFWSFVGWHGRADFAAVKGRVEKARFAQDRADDYLNALMNDDANFIGDWDDE